MEFHASCSEGLQTLLEKEIQSYGLKITSSNRGGVFFRGNKWEDAEKFFYSTRISSGLGLVLINGKVENYEDLYKLAFEFPWEKLFPERHSFRIDSQTKDALPDSRFSMYKLKDAILDRYRDMETPIPDVDKDVSDITYRIRSHQNNVSIEVLLSPISLTKRGYRTQAGDASLRENIAQALLEFSGWNTAIHKFNPSKTKTDTDITKEYRPILLDPFCGQGTILIEAALNLKKKGMIQKEKMEASLVFRRMKDHFTGGMSRIISIEKESESSTPPSPFLFGFDKDPAALELARKDSQKAGVSDWIVWVEADLENFTGYVKKNLSIEKNLSNIWIITDPPYGKRLGTRDEAREIFYSLGKTLKSWEMDLYLTLITGDSSLLGPLRLKKDSEMNLKNAGLSSKIVNYKLAKSFSSSEITPSNS